MLEKLPTILVTVAWVYSVIFYLLQYLFIIEYLTSARFNSAGFWLSMLAIRSWGWGEDTSWCCWPAHPSFPRAGLLRSVHSMLLCFARTITFRASRYWDTLALLFLCGYGIQAALWDIGKSMHWSGDISLAIQLDLNLVDICTFARISYRWYTLQGSL